MSYASRLFFFVVANAQAIALTLTPPPLSSPTGEKKAKEEIGVGAELASDGKVEGKVERQRLKLRQRVRVKLKPRRKRSERMAGE